MLFKLGGRPLHLTLYPTRLDQLYVKIIWGGSNFVLLRCMGQCDSDSCGFDWLQGTSRCDLQWVITTKHMAAAVVTTDSDEGHMIEICVGPGAAR